MNDLNDLARTQADSLAKTQDLLREILTYRPNILDGTISCRYCAALVLNENEERHMRWHQATASRLKGRP